MAGMSRNNSASSLQGFSVFQASIGAPLQFLPALGSKQLDDLVNAYLPGPASIKEKRATISMDFCEYARLTGETFKYYAVLSQSVDSVTTGSPVSSTMHDSGYGSSFNVSPVVSDVNLWCHSPSFISTSSHSPFVALAPSQQKAPASASRKPSSSLARSQTTDFSHLPGMKIMTADGQDVTNSASRGCKTKEQRDHAHLMRILKACESCKKKKIRCDPSHKKRAASQAQADAESKPAKRSKKPTSQAVQQPSSFAEASLHPEGAPFELDWATTAVAEESVAALEEPWDQFLQYDHFDQPTHVNPPDYDQFFFDPENLFSSPSSDSSVSLPHQPFTPAAGAPASAIFGDGSPLADIDSQEPTLPYLNLGVSGSNYVDFNLYSPTSSFLDEEPQNILTKPIKVQQATDYRSRGT
ncbi:Transcription factor Cys6 [Pleurostoma richardsiae]|uniref:Transcription factor Cys6 n=1 Tax=Pleurostoma richardsiae TaxID=41990 RepID=A0AA38R381_9PEZI|nr:Transcription factor Cys6 [Pleurostoma richardsiae]